MDADITTCRERLPARLLRAEEGYQETLRRVEENDDTLKSLQIDTWDFNDNMQADSTQTLTVIILNWVLLSGRIRI